jgi:hypothetical protein
MSCKDADLHYVRNHKWGWEGLEDLAEDKEEKTTLINTEICFVTS